MTIAVGRRSFVTSLAAAGCALCAAKSAAAADAHWSYEGEGAPQNWGHLEAEFRSCEIGLQQSPVDLRRAVRAPVGPVEPSLRAMPLKIVNNGHTIQVNCEPGSTTRINGVPFALVQFHFHHPSEHLLSGRRFDLEVHFVHRSEAGEVAVLGVFCQPGAENAALAPIWAAMPAEEGPERTAPGNVEPAGLLPRRLGLYSYLGSLTTPPCSQGVDWFVFREPIAASAAQIQRFAQLFPLNARPVQRLNNRVLVETR
jgi:carbonic anhydrase